jgi:hypothetical protein
MPETDPFVITQRNEIQYSVQYERDNAVRWRDILTGRTQTGTKTVRRLLLGAGMRVPFQINRSMRN